MEMIRVLYCGYNENTYLDKKCPKTLTIMVDAETPDSEIEAYQWFCCDNHLQGALTDIRGYEMH